MNYTIDLTFPNFNTELNMQETSTNDVKILTRSYLQRANINIHDIQICNQAINWTNLSNDRDLLKKHRLRTHAGHRNSPELDIDKNERKEFFNKTNKDIFYQFRELYYGIPISLQHFQLRKNLKMLNSKEIVYCKSFGIEKLNLITKKRQFLVVFDNEEMMDYGKVVCFDLVMLDNNKMLIVCGKMDGLIILYTVIADKNAKSLQPPISKIRKCVSDEGEFQITNKVKFLEGGSKLLICSNDGHVKILDLENDFNVIKSYLSPAAVNDCDYTSNLLVTVGDYETVEIFDFKTTEKISSVKGHVDFGFSSVFQNNSEYILATGNQDYKCKIWDLRKISSDLDANTANSACILTLCGHFDSIGNIAFTPDNNYIMYSENTDYFYIYNLKSHSLQSLEYFGSTTGFAINDNIIYLGIHEYSHPGIMVYDKIRDNKLDLNNILI